MKAYIKPHLRTVPLDATLPLCTSKGSTSDDDPDETVTFQFRTSLNSTWSDSDNHQIE